MLEKSVAPGLLLAMPQLDDPNFRRSVVLMVEHGDHGSLGLVVNRPSPIPVAALLESVGVGWEGDPAEVVGVGGPVMAGSLWLLHPPPGPDDLPVEGSLALVPGISLSTSRVAIERLARRPPQRLRFLLGYAGWGPGQLAGETAHGSWLPGDATAEIVFDTPPAAMWDKALRALGVDPAALAPTASGLN